MTKKKSLDAQGSAALLDLLEARFRKYPDRHPEISWEELRARLESNPGKLWSLSEMERTGGEPDVIGRDGATGAFLFADCAPESPAGRRNICYDRAALESRKTFKPETSAMDMAEEMGVELLTEEEYRRLQTLGSFDLKTSSWIKTPDSVRRRGGALFCDRRYDMVFVYHNGAESYYAVRGFRGILRV